MVSKKNQIPLNEVMGIIAKKETKKTTQTTKLIKVALMLGGAFLCFSLAKDIKTRQTKVIIGNNKSR